MKLIYDKRQELYFFTNDKDVLKIKERVFYYELETIVDYFLKKTVDESDYKYVPDEDCKTVQGHKLALIARPYHQVVCEFRTKEELKEKFAEFFI